LYILYYFIFKAKNVAYEITAILNKHKDRVNCVKWLEREGHSGNNIYNVKCLYKCLTNP